MTRKTATAEKQPDLLGAAAPKVDPPKPRNAVAKADPKRTASNVTKLEPKTLIDRLREISDKKDVELAREILAMIRGEEDRAAERAFNMDMLAAQSAMPAVKRNAFNKHTESWWARLETISKIADPIIRKHGFTLSYGMETSPLAEHYRVVCDVSHRDGHRRRYDADVGMDSKGAKGGGTKSLAQGSGSSITYARRFLKCMIFDIVVEGMDNDGNGAPPRRSDVIDATPGEPREPVALVTDKQAETLIELIEAKGRTRAAFCKSWEIVKVADLPAADYETAIVKLRALKEHHA